jgi:hypothetical protein
MVTTHVHACAYIHVCVPEWEVPSLVICRILWPERWTSSSRIIWLFCWWFMKLVWWCDAHFPSWCHGDYWHAEALQAIPLHHWDHFGTCDWVCKVGCTTGLCQILSVAPTLFEPLAPVKHCCKLQMVITVCVLHSRINECWSCTLRAQKPGDTAFLVPGWIHNCTPLSNTMLCSGHTEQPVYDMWL